MFLDVPGMIQFLIARSAFLVHQPNKTSILSFEAPHNHIQSQRINSKPQNPQSQHYPHVLRPQLCHRSLRWCLELQQLLLAELLLHPLLQGGGSVEMRARLSHAEK